MTQINERGIDHLPDNSLLVIPIQHLHGVYTPWYVRNLDAGLPTSNNQQLVSTTSTLTETRRTYGQTVIGKTQTEQAFNTLIKHTQSAFAGSTYFLKNKLPDRDRERLTQEARALFTTVDQYYHLALFNQTPPDLYTWPEKKLRDLLQFPSQDEHTDPFYAYIGKKVTEAVRDIESDVAEKLTGKKSPNIHTELIQMLMVYTYAQRLGIEGMEHAKLQPTQIKMKHLLELLPQQTKLIDQTRPFFSPIIANLRALPDTSSNDNF